MKLIILLIFPMLLLACAPDSPDLLSGWKWVRESPDDWSLEGGALKLRTQPDRIWAGEGSKNLLITDQLIGLKAEAVADVELLNAIGKWEQCGLLVYVNDDSFVKLIVEHIDGPHFVVMAQETEKKRKVLCKIEMPEKRAQLRFEVDGNTVRGYWRLIGEPNWQNAATAQTPQPGQQRFGLFSQDGPRDESRFALVRQLYWNEVSE